MRKFVAHVLALLMLFGLTACQPENGGSGTGGSPLGGGQTKAATTWKDMSHGEKTKWILSHYGGYPETGISTRDDGAEIGIAGCKVWFSANDQQARPGTHDPNLSIQRFAEWWALSVGDLEGKKIPPILRELFWFDGNTGPHYTVNVDYQRMRSAILEAQAAGTIECKPDKA